ncbi:MAG: hypothetical protein U1F10_05315 [Burkholderiales bacterium]
MNPPARVVLFATPRAAPDLPVPADYPAALLPLGHASVAERMVEQFVACGCRDVDLVVSDRPERLRELLGDGERWGLRLRWRLAKDPLHPYAALAATGCEPGARVLVGHADHWIGSAALRRLCAADTLLMRLDAGDNLAWSGWAALPAALLYAVSPHCDRRALGARLAATGLRPLIAHDDETGTQLDARGLMQAQRALIAGTPEAPWPIEWIATPWGAMSPQARVHRNARMRGPVLVGPGSIVAADARVGPNVVLARDVIVEARTTVQDATVLAGTYMGPGLDVSDAIVNGGRLRNLALGADAVLPRSEGLLMSLHPEGPPRASAMGRAVAFAAAVVLAPPALVAAAAKPWREPWSPWVRQHVVVGLDDATRQLVTVPLRCPRKSAGPARRLAAAYGALLDVAQGRRHWFGVRPRRSGEWHALNPEWQALLASAPIGLFNAPAWAADDGVRLEADAAADVFFAVRRNWRENLRIVMAALRGPRTA